MVSGTTPSIIQPDKGAPLGTRITIPMPDDFHHHGRDGAKTAAVLEHATKQFHRCLFMPNLVPPLTTTEKALEYKAHIQKSMPSNSDSEKFEPVMVLYLTDHTTAEEIYKAQEAGIVGVKYYPAGATTNSQFGVSDIQKCYPALQALQDRDMMLCIHSEVTDPKIDIFDREPLFIEEIIKPLVNAFPTLKMTMEHISTKQAVDYVMNEAPDRVKASITCHHLLYNRNHMLVGGIRPHLYCLPILKAEIHRKALLDAATSGSPKFFLGTDSAPHMTILKEAACGCAGVYTAHAAVELYTTAFDMANALDKLGDFCSKFGAQHYGMPVLTASDRSMTLEKRPWKVPDSYAFGSGTTLTPLMAGEEIPWAVVES
eukprot:CAMPEP_0168723142 /NCGR_PEP_ID=MMETSP0724-20121128/2965_1 /TAXON_ID=265536 /ORGANISM="Amphiprora sp., Strain CCMP467" /LENGTH=370 /DNA_ID=CAMNT_0008769845 /DNA_START=244 /DNA_END=1356 /DNA_ORIENTATION=-